jgi:hypothetical protein
MTEYVQSERITDLGDAKTRFEWQSVDDFERFIRSIAPKGKIIGIYGQGYEGSGGDLEPRPPLRLIITTMRLKAVVDRELARAAEKAKKAEEAAKKRAEAAAKKAAEKKAREYKAELKLDIKRIKQRLDDKRAEIENFYLENPDISRGGKQ